MRTLIQDLSYALRSFAKTPGFTAVVVVSIALGIAANSTVYSVVNSLVYAAIPVEKPDRLFTMNDGSSVSWPNYRDVRDQATGKVFSGVSAFFPLVPANIGGNGQPERVWGQLATGNFFDVAGVRPILGRTFLPDEDKVENRDAVIVLGHALWQRRFGADPSIVGRTIPINGRPYQVIGVAPPGFTGTVKVLTGEFWVPLSMYAHLVPDMARENLKEQRTAQWLIVDARLKDGVSREQAMAALAVIQNQIHSTYFKNDKNRPTAWTLNRAGRMPDFANLMGLMAVLMVVVGLVLLIACANVANLMLARAATRAKEIAIRLSIGASRWRLVWQLLTESVFLAMGGAGLGFVLAAFAASALSRFQLPISLPIAFNFTPDWRVVLYTIAISVFTGILFGLMPALRATRTDLVTSLKDDNQGLPTSRRFGLRNVLVVVQVAFSLLLLVGAGLFVRSLQNASSIDLGMRADNVLMLGFDPKLNGYTPQRHQQFLLQLREKVSAVPGVRAVSYVDSIPLSIGGVNFDFESSTPEGGKKNVNGDVYRVGRGYFEAMGIPRLRGRDFVLSDADGTAILNEKSAQALFPNGNAVGQTITADKHIYEVIGVVKTSKSRTLGEEPRTAVYLSLEGAPEKVMSFFGTSLVVRTAGNPARYERSIREIFAQMDSTLAITGVETMQQHVDKALLLPKVCAVLLGVFGLIGLTLATVGLYGLLSYVVRARTREIGIRMALGAERGRVLALIAQQGMTLTGIGMGIGLAISAAVTRFAAAFLYGVDAHDAVTFVGVPLVLLAVAGVAVFGPAWRAARIEPMIAVRHE